MKRLLLLPIFFMALVWQTPLLAAEVTALSVRMVQASKQALPVDPRLKDVQALLAENTPGQYSHFAMVSQGELAGAKGQVKLAQDFVLEFTPQGEHTQVRITQGGQEKLKALLNLQAGVPLCLGGFPSGDGKVIFVILGR